MSGDDTDYELSRRTFAKAAGAAAGGGLLGVSTGTAAAQEGGFDATFANPRVQEARKVWDRGFRGRHDRTIGLTDSGLDARHPDIGPWTGVRAIDDDGTFRLVDPDGTTETRSQVYSSDPDFSESATVEPGAFPAGSEKVIYTFELSDSSYDTANRFATAAMPSHDLELDATLSWSPNADASNDLEFRLDRLVDGSWEEYARTATAGMPERLTGVTLEPDSTYRLVAEMYINTTTEATVSGNFFSLRVSYDEVAAEGVFDRPAADGSTARPKCLAWADPDSRFGTLAKPRDPDGHGSHCASIMGGSGRASAVARVVEQDEGMNTVLLPGDFLEYEIEVGEDDGGVYVSAYGENLELFIYDADESETLDSSTVGIDDTSAVDNNVAEAPVDEPGTCLVRVKPANANSPGAEVQDQEVEGQRVEGQRVGSRSVGDAFSSGRVTALSVGTLAEPSAGEGDRSSGEVSLHSGVAPDAGLVGLQGFGAPVAMLAEHGEAFAGDLNLRTVNMSWGYVGGLPLGGLGQGLDGGVVGDVGGMAEAGILSVAAAGNAATPANGNGAPAVADEAVSVVATGPRDGISGYSSGGIGGNDEDDGGQYMKPDVTAPGGTLTDLATAAAADTDADAFDADTAPRDYTGKAGTSMASPYTNGTAGLVAEAMEFGEATPDAIRLPEPADTGFDDVMRLKQVLLATASETAFTAAPYHRAKAPGYGFGERDPYEGYGRINPDAAVDAVTRPLLTGLWGLDPEASTSVEHGATLGLDVPSDSRAVAGFVDAPEGSLEVSLSFSGFSGSNQSLTKGNPWVDMFVYDAANPADNGEPSIVSRVQCREGAGSVSVDVGEGGDVYYVVAKLVNVPGVVNGFDVQVNVDLGLSFTRAALPTFAADGRRTDDAAQFTAGQTNEVRVEIDDLTELGDDVPVRVRDRIPSEWDVLEEYSDDVVATETTDGVTLVDFGTVTPGELGPESPDGEYGSAPGEFSYLADAPEEAGEYTFGPAVAEVSNPERKGVSNRTATFGGTETNVVVSTSTDTSTTDADSTTGTDTGTTDGTTDDSTVGDAVDDGTSTLTDSV